MSKERIFTVRPTGHSPEEEEKIRKLIEERVEESIRATQHNVPFLFDISGLKNRKHQAKTE